MPPPLYRRSAFQVGLLLFATFGIYVFWWAYWARRTCAAILERQDQPLWKTIALLIPIFNLFLLFDLGQMVQGVKWRTDPSKRDEWLPWLGVSVFFFNVAGRLSGVVSDLGTIGFLPIALVQRALSRAQIALYGEAAVPTGFHWLEWVVTVLGCLFWAVVMVGVAISGPQEYTLDEKRSFFVAVGLAVVILVWLWRASRAAIVEGRAMYANPSPDRILPADHIVGSSI
jgi:hypothetical protein